VLIAQFILADYHGNIARGGIPDAIEGYGPPHFRVQLGTFQVDSEETGMGAFAGRFPPYQFGKLRPEHFKASVEIDSEEPPGTNRNDKSRQTGNRSIGGYFFQDGDWIGKTADLGVPHITLVAISVEMKINESGTDNTFLRADLTVGIYGGIAVPAGYPAGVVYVKFGGFISNRTEDASLGERSNDLIRFNGQMVF
jgi:hypothetical protein